MPKVTLVIPPAIRSFVGGQSRVQVDAMSASEALQQLSSSSEGLRTRLFDEADAINRFVRIFVDGRQITAVAAKDEPLADGAEITLLLALAGG